MKDWQVTFAAMVDKAAAELESTMREDARAGRFCDVGVYAVSTRHDLGRDGSVVIARECPDYPPGDVHYIPPHMLGASTFERWSSVPYSAIRGILAQALRRSPILPIERPEA